MTEQAVPDPEKMEEEVVSAFTEAADDTGSAVAEDSEDTLPDVPGAEEIDVQESPSDGSVVFSLLAGIVGCFVGWILCALGGGTSTTLGLFLFLLIPLAIGAANLLFNGSRGIPGLVITIIFSVLGVWLVPALTTAAASVMKQGLSILSAPLVALTKVGSSGYFSDLAFDTAHVFPVVFAVIGVWIVWQLYQLKKH